MAATDSIMYSLERNWEMVKAAIADLDYETMARLPNEQSNSVSWIFGHISRVTDLFIMHRLQVPAAAVVCRRLVREVRPRGQSGWPRPHR